MRRLALAALLPLLAAPLARPAEAQEWVPRRVAVLQALDKVTARITVLRATLNQPERFGSLTITVRACHARPPDEVPDAAAWMEISDSRAPEGTNPVFRGWMFAEAPGVNMLQHPVYDIRILECRAAQ
ncbi:DUF2155 domain-containing protein [Falsiroseomonas tokyonensis]|uniref:DUF2155 domain-containing protein n=1 Tax=Falsiroseomonas tokyonensis TaxID=430521 RepID=A0ABV7BXF4_9PROT|nr:DUF2155 domain-containing protein [Falsiroseomonas tokyonensis]MBU8538606.1 DUF2155 domain-containing protein [Falsiroseomonas tokyonensis]